MNYINPFLLSAMTEENPFISTTEVIDWLQKLNKNVVVEVEEVPFSQLTKWKFYGEKERLIHESGRFFSIDGIHVNVNNGTVREWEQPIINQPEIGYLGILTKEFNGILYFLMQAKIEPGNINAVQLSPTLQATKSNYLRLHGGRSPKYLDHFVNKRGEILLDQLQSEQGARFLRKRNRNIIIQIFEEIEVESEFIWLTLGQIKKLMQYENLVNMDTRTVISGIPFRTFGDIGVHSLTSNPSISAFLLSSVSQGLSLYSFGDLVAWLTNLKCQYELSITSKSLNRISEWKISEHEIAHNDNKYFKVIGAKITISNREVSSWCQPLIKPSNVGIIGMIVKKINGILHCLIQAKLECGNFDILELAPTVQCLTGNYKEPEYEVPYLDFILSSNECNVIYDTMQSEEGGRFFHEQNRNIIVEVGEDFLIDVPYNFKWMTLNQLNMFITFNNYLNIQARSLVAAISFI